MCDALDGFYFENTVWGFYRWGPPYNPSDWILFCLISQSHRHRPVIGCPLRRLTGWAEENEWIEISKNKIQLK